MCMFRRTSVSSRETMQQQNDSKTACRRALQQEVAVQVFRKCESVVHFPLPLSNVLFLGRNVICRLEGESCFVRSDTCACPSTRHGCFQFCCSASIVLCSSPSPPLDLALPIECNQSYSTEGECCFVASVVSAWSWQLKCMK